MNKLKDTETIVFFMYYCKITTTRDHKIKNVNTANLLEESSTTKLK